MQDAATGARQGAVILGREVLVLFAVVCQRFPVRRHERLAELLASAHQRLCWREWQTGLSAWRKAGAAGAPARPSARTCSRLTWCKVTFLLAVLKAASLPPKPKVAPTGRLNHFGACVVAELDAELKASPPACGGGGGVWMGRGKAMGATLGREGGERWRERESGLLWRKEIIKAYLCARLKGVQADRTVKG